MLCAVNNRIVIKPDVCNGKPIIAGTRIAVETVLEFLGAGDSIADVLDEYPSLTEADVLACIQCAKDIMSHHYSVTSTGAADELALAI
jgi:uncharacterized protein (DUF433 family)